MTLDLAGDRVADAHSPTIARRSISIFSRRGCETPKPTTQALGFSGIDMASGMWAPLPYSSLLSSSGSSKARNKRWTFTGRAETIPEGTILRTVPKESPRPNLMPLEREMAVAPNEEVLRSVGMPLDSAPGPVISSSSPLADVSKSPITNYLTKKSRKDNEDVAGFWRDGRVSWGKDYADREQSARTPKAPNGSRQIQKFTKAAKPKIQVIIPESQSARRPYQLMPLFYATEVAVPDCNLEISRPSLSSAVSLDSACPSTVVLSAIHVPAPDAPAPPPPTPVHLSPSPDTTAGGHLSLSFGTTAGGHLSPSFDSAAGGAHAVHEMPSPDRPLHARSASNTSTISDSDGEEASLSRSTRSSMTSIDEHTVDSVLSGDDKRSSSSCSLASSQASFQPSDDARALQTPPNPSPEPLARYYGPESEDYTPRLVDLVDIMRTRSTQRRPGESPRRISSSRPLSRASISSREQLKIRPVSPSLDEAMRGLEDSLSAFRSDDEGLPEVVERAKSPGPQVKLAPTSAPELPRKSSKRISSTRAKFDSMSAPKPSPALQASIDKTRLMNAQRRQKMRDWRLQINNQTHRGKSARPVLSLVFEEDESQPVDVGMAETVIYQILARMQSMDDLFSTARMNKAFYGVFKRNTLPLMKQTLYRRCAPHWELRETHLTSLSEEGDGSAAPAAESTPSAYYHGLRAEAEVMASIRALMSKHCQSMLRSETLQHIQDAESTRINAALCRIWTFCHVFGCGRDREDDLVAQMDWLRGGTLAHQHGCTSTISTHDSFYFSGVLLSAPEHFAKGNVGGLSAGELYDMLEVWACLATLTGGVVGQTQLARQFGVFDVTDVVGGDVDGEEAMLEEWHAHLMSLGLERILEIAAALQSEGIHAAFAVSHYKGLTTWTPPMPGTSRVPFLHEAVSRLYEERLCETFSSDPKAMHSFRRARNTAYAQRKRSMRSMPARAPPCSHNSARGARSICSSTGATSRPVSSSDSSPSHPASATYTKPLPALPGSQDPSPPMPARTPPLPPRPAAILYTRSAGPEPIAEEPPSSAGAGSSLRSSSSSSSSSSSGSRDSSVHPLFHAQTFQARARPPQSCTAHSSDQYSHGTSQAHGSSRASHGSSRHSHSSSQHSHSSSQHSHSSSQHYHSSSQHSHGSSRASYADAVPFGPESDSEAAVFRIVEMGFTPEEAKSALKTTDFGDGVVVERAVEWLMRVKGFY